jgi:hypothetical protein
MVPKSIPMRKYVSAILSMSLFCFSACETVPKINYTSSSRLERGTAFSRASKIAIEVDLSQPIEFRRHLLKVEAAAKAAGLHCTTLAEAEYAVSITTGSHGISFAEGALVAFGIKGKAYRLSEGGAKRSLHSEWEGSVSGQTIGPVDVDSVIARFVSTIAVERAK